MPNPLSADEKRLLNATSSLVNSLRYAASWDFLHRPQNRAALMSSLRTITTGMVPASASPAPDVPALHDQMLVLLDAYKNNVIGKFMDQPANRNSIATNVRTTVMPMIVTMGCGDLCYDKEKGCVEC